MNVKKEVRNGEVAVLYSPGYGAGWSTWSSDPVEREKLMFDPSIVYMVEQMHDVPEELDWQTHVNQWMSNISEYMEANYPHFYDGGAEDLCIAWLPEGTEFRIDEYDGSETLELKQKMPWVTA